MMRPALGVNPKVRLSVECCVDMSDPSPFPQFSARFDSIRLDLAPLALSPNTCVPVIHRGKPLLHSFSIFI